MAALCISSIHHLLCPIKKQNILKIQFIKKKAGKLGLKSEYIVCTTKSENIW